MSLTIEKLAELVGGKLSGDGSLEIFGIANLETAQAGEISFVEKAEFAETAQKATASCLIVSENFEHVLPCSSIRVKNPKLAFAQIAGLLHQPERKFGINENAQIAKSAKIGQEVFIGAFASIGENADIGERTQILDGVKIGENVKIGTDCFIFPNIVIYENVTVGENVIIHAGAIIGADGFGFVRGEEGYVKFPQIGTVVIEDDVEIGAGTCIDCASVGETRIKRGAKIDNLVQIGHSCTIEEDALICAQTGLAGSSVIGKRVILAGQVGIAGHLRVGDDVVITAKSATSHDVADGKILSGIPAFDNRDWLRSIAAFRRLGEMAQTLRRLEKRLPESDAD